MQLCLVLPQELEAGERAKRASLEGKSSIRATTKLTHSIQMDDAEALFKRGLQIANKMMVSKTKYNEIAINATAACLSNYGSFLKSVRGYSTEAEKMHEMAISIAPNHGGCVGNYAKFLMDARHDFISAEEMFRRAIELDPTHSSNLATFARMLKKMGRFDQAEEIYKKALAVDGKNVVCLCNYANFLKKVRGDIEGARVMYLRGLKENPNADFLQRNYALFLRDTSANFANAKKIAMEKEQAQQASARVYQAQQQQQQQQQQEQQVQEQKQEEEQEQQQENKDEVKVRE